MLRITKKYYYYIPSFQQVENKIETVVKLLLSSESVIGRSIIKLGSPLLIAHSTLTPTQDTVYSGHNHCLSKLTDSTISQGPTIFDLCQEPKRNVKSLEEIHDLFSCSVTFKKIGEFRYGFLQHCPLL